MKGVFNQNPTKPRFTTKWDVEIITIIFENEAWNPVKNLSLIRLTMKTAILILLVTIQQGQIVSALSLGNMTQTENQICFKIDVTMLKQGLPGYKPNLLKFRKYCLPELCIFSHLCEYNDRIEPLRGDEDQLSLACIKPYHAVSRDNLSHWVKKLCQKLELILESSSPAVPELRQARRLLNQEYHYVKFFVLGVVPWKYLLKMVKERDNLVKWNKACKGIEI